MENVFHYEEIKKFLVMWAPCFIESGAEGQMLGYSFVIFGVLAMVVNASRYGNFRHDMLAFNLVLIDGPYKEAMVQMLEDGQVKG